MESSESSYYDDHSQSHRPLSELDLSLCVCVCVCVGGGVCVCVCVWGGGVWVCEEGVGVTSLGELAHVQRENDFTKKTE